MTTERACVYEVDAEYRIVSVNEEWSRFALENDAHQLLPPAIIGTSLFDHISDSTTAHLYERLFAEAAQRKTPVAVPIRCDAPALKRFLTLEIVPLRSGHRVVSTTVGTEPREPMPLLDSHVSRARDWIRMCSWCKNVEVGGEWKTAEAAAVELRLLERDALPQVTHAICPSCKASIEVLLPDAPSAVTG